MNQNPLEIPFSVSIPVSKVAPDIQQQVELLEIILSRYLNKEDSNLSNAFPCLFSYIQEENLLQQCMELYSSNSKVKKLVNRWSNRLLEILNQGKDISLKWMASCLMLETLRSLDEDTKYYDFVEFISKCWLPSLIELLKRNEDGRVYSNLILLISTLFSIGSYFSDLNKQNSRSISNTFPIFLKALSSKPNCKEGVLHSFFLCVTRNFGSVKSFLPKIEKNCIQLLIDESESVREKSIQVLLTIESTESSTWENFLKKLICSLQFQLDEISERMEKKTSGSLDLFFFQFLIQILFYTCRRRYRNNYF